jgi:hypothetical protein
MDKVSDIKNNIIELRKTFNKHPIITVICIIIFIIFIFIIRPYCTEYFGAKARQTAETQNEGAVSQKPNYDKVKQSNTPIDKIPDNNSDKGAANNSDKIVNQNVKGNQNVNVIGDGNSVTYTTSKQQKD